MTFNNIASFFLLVGCTFAVCCTIHSLPFDICARHINGSSVKTTNSLFISRIRVSRVKNPFYAFCAWEMLTQFSHFELRLRGWLFFLCIFAISCAPCLIVQSQKGLKRYITNRENHLNVRNENLSSPNSDAQEFRWSNIASLKLLGDSSSLACFRVIHDFDSDMIYEFEIISMDNWQLSTTLHHFLPRQRLGYAFCCHHWRIPVEISIKHVTLCFLCSDNSMTVISSLILK